MDELPANTATTSERLVRLELMVSYERQRMDYNLAQLYHRLQTLEIPQPHTAHGRDIKLWAALLLPLLVLLLTGDLQAAIRALRAAAG